ncbi:MAG TPA: DUF1634 domain-containing protein, partial [Vicinamibacteria bacterium]
SALLLLAGLAGWREGLRLGIVLLLLTPVARVLVVTVGLVLARDWLFGLVSSFVLAVLLSGMFVSFRIATQRPAAPTAAAPR